MAIVGLSGDWQISVLQNAEILKLETAFISILFPCNPLDQTTIPIQFSAVMLIFSPTQYLVLPNTIFGVFIGPSSIIIFTEFSDGELHVPILQIAVYVVVVLGDILTFKPVDPSDQVKIPVQLVAVNEVV